MDPRIVHKGNAEHYVWGANCDGWRLVDTPGLSVIHERMPPGAAKRAITTTAPGSVSSCCGAR